MGIFSRGKYSKIIKNSERQFIQTWNNSLHPDERTADNYFQTAMMNLFFYAEKARLDSDDFSKMVFDIRKSSPFHRLIAGVNVNVKKANSDYYSNTYGYYLSAIREGKNTGEAYIYAAERQSKLDSTLNL
jgi:hypothetical protein